MNPVADEDWVAKIDNIAKQMQRESEEAARTLPCRLDLAQVSACSDSFAAGCEFAQRRRQDCPRFKLAEQRAQIDKERAGKRQAAAERGIPERVLRQVFDQTPRQTPALDAVRAFMRDPGKSVLVLSGTNACGKTTAAAWACLPPPDADWPAPRPGRFLRLVDLESDGRYGDLIKLARTASLLVLDDVGAAHFGQSGFMVSMVDDVVDAVYQSCNKIILTTDLSMAPDPKDPERPCLAKLLSRRVLSRIKDAGIVEAKLGGRHGA